MNTRLMMIGSVLMASLLCSPAMAQPGPVTGEMPGMGMGSGMMQGAGPKARAPRDCSLSANPAACTAHREARAKAMEACQNKAGPERRECLRTQRKPMDCSQSGNPQACAVRQQAYRDCQGQPRPAFRQCVQQKMAAVDCSKALNPARCELHQKARQACQDKLGPEHKACLREQFNVQ